MKKLPFIFLFLFKFLISSAQTASSCHKEGGAFISEVGNISHADYIELTVYGSTSNPTAPVNLENWILDDNNFNTKQTGSHTGHIRLGECFKAVMPGTVVLIYTNFQDQLISDLDAPSGYNMRLSQTCLIRINTLNVLDKDGNKKQLKFKVEIKKAEVEPSPVLFCGGIKQITVKGIDPLWFNGSTNESVDIDKPGKYSVQVTDESGCRINGEVEVLDARNPNSIRRYFEAAGFEAVTQNVRIVSVAGKPSKDKDSTMAAKPSTTCVQKFSNDQLFINNEYMDLEELGADICYYEPDFANLHIISDNDNFCKNGNLDAIEQMYASNDKAVWYHLWTNGNESILFYKFSQPTPVKHKCSLNNLKNVFKEYEGGKKYKMWFIVPELVNKKYELIAEIKNNWMFGIVTVDANNKINVQNIFNNNNLSQQEKEIQMRFGNKTYNMNSIFCFYDDIRKGDFADNKKSYPERLELIESGGCPQNLHKERATPLYEDNNSLINISPLQTNYLGGERIVSGEPGILATHQIEYTKVRDLNSVVSLLPNFTSWLHVHPLFEYQFEATKDYHYYVQPALMQYKNTGNRPLEIEYNPSNFDFKNYYSKASYFSIAIAYDHIIFFQSIGKSCPGFYSSLPDNGNCSDKSIRINRKGYDKSFIKYKTD